MFKLFPDQERDKRALRELVISHQRVLLAAATGYGKTVLAGNLSQSLRKNGRKILVLVHRRELVKQFFNTLKDAGLHREVSLVCPGYTPIPWAPIQIGMVFSWIRRKPIFQPDMIFIDEAHHVKAKSWQDVLDMYPDSKAIGMTATPVRLDGKPLNPPFQAMHCGDPIGTLIQNKRLSPVRVIRVPIGFVVGKRKKDYATKSLDKKASPAVVANAANAYCKYIPGKKTIMFGVTKRHAKETAEALKARGVRAAYVGDDTETHLREEIFRLFADGQIEVICNVSLIDEGFDVPDCEAVMDVRPTESVTRFLQAVGRGLRYIPGKVAILLDLVGNTFRHGLPDINRVWSLDDVDNGQPEDPKEGGSNLRCCKSCLTLYNRSHSQCPFCGHVPKGREIIEVDVELEEVLGAEDVMMENPKQKKSSRITPSDRARLIRECRKLIREGKMREAWAEIDSLTNAAGYHQNWGQTMADMLGIPEHIRYTRR